MTGAFPEIKEAALAQLPGDTGLDGELVVLEGGRLAFERLQQRLARRRGAGALAAAQTWPAHLVTGVRTGFRLLDEGLSEEGGRWATLVRGVPRRREISAITRRFQERRS